MARYSGYGVIGLAMVLLGVLILIPFLKQMFPQIENFNNPPYKDPRLYNMLVNRYTREPKCSIVKRCPDPRLYCKSYNEVLRVHRGIDFGDPQRNGVCLKDNVRMDSAPYITLSEDVVKIYNNYLSTMPMRDVKKEMQEQKAIVNNKGGTNWMNSNFQMT
jgi:hypothetical protein